MSIALLPFVLLVASIGGDASPVGSATEARDRLAACEADSSRGEMPWERVNACQVIARDLLRLGDEGDRDRLWDRVERAEPDDPLLWPFLSSLLASHVEEAVRTRGDTEAPAIPAAATSQLPEGLDHVSPELQAAVRLYRGLHEAAWPESTAPEAERIAFMSQEGRSAFVQGAAELLRGRARAADTLALLDRFEYGLGCGNGASQFVEAMAFLRLVASLREGRVEPGHVGAYVLSPARWDALDGADRDLMRAAGIDWELLFVGELASGGGIGHVDPLLRAGSDRAVRLLLELMDLERPLASFEGADFRGLLLGPMAGFVTARGPCDGYGGSSSDDYERDADAPSIDPALQDAIVERLERAVQPGGALGEAEAASHALLRLCRPDSAGAFATMLRSPYSHVRQRGAVALRALGEPVRDPEPAQPVAVRLLVDGRPWSSYVSWDLDGPGWSVPAAPADGQGVVGLDRDPFLDPTVPVESVRLGSDVLRSPDQAWFSVRFPPPVDLETRTLVTVETGSLTVVVPPSVATPQPGLPGASLTLVADTDDGPTVISDLSVREGRYVFPRLQHGTYTATVFVPGGRLHQAAGVTVGARPATAEVAPLIPHALVHAGPDEGELPEP